MACTIDRSRPILTWACQTKVWTPELRMVGAKQLILLLIVLISWKVLAPKFVKSACSRRFSA